MKKKIAVPLTRREAINRLGLLSLGSVLAPGWLKGADPESATSHPHIFITLDENEGRRSLASVREAIRGGIPRRIWEKILEECEAEVGGEALLATSVFPGRNLVAARLNNPDYTICRAVGQRILRNALALLITQDERYRETALRQMRALFDEDIWPDWIDQSSKRFGHPAGLRTGMLSQDVALGFDWMHPYLSREERERILEGVDRRGIQPYFTSMEQDPWWSHDLNNWYTVIIGGLGIAGMALGEAHPQSQLLIEMSLSRMRKYLSIYGEGGEFNESVAYSNATRIPVAYFLAYYYHAQLKSNPLAEHPFPQTGEWTIYSTLPPGRYAAFGDGWIGAKPQVQFMSAIAAAARDPLMQGFVERHLDTSSNPHVLLWFDPTLKGTSPEGRLPRGRAFRDNGAHIFSRTDWNPETTAMVVYGKAGRDHNHDHNDMGQVCIDAHGERMITDLGSPSSYPKGFFDEPRWEYYNASAKGHNVPMFGGREQRSQPHTRGVKELFDYSAVSGRIIQAEFNNDMGGFWKMDLTRAYDGVVSVMRTVVHLFPGYVAVLDEAELEKAEAISLRWHTITPAPPDEAGKFTVKSNGAALAGLVDVLEGGEAEIALRRHEYKPPWHLARTGEPLEQRREPYVEALLTGSRCRILSLFALLPNDSSTAEWRRKKNAWRIAETGVSGRVRLDDETLQVENLVSKKQIAVTL